MITQIKAEVTQNNTHEAKGMIIQNKQDVSQCKKNV